MNLFRSRLPEETMHYSLQEVLEVLYQHYGAAVGRALEPGVQMVSPLEQEQDTKWLKTANTVGINVRTLGSFWKIIPYAMTLPSAQNAVHILPIWEPGVVASLYGPCSWNINPEFYSEEMAQLGSHLNTVEAQLKAVVNLLHVMGKAVGMDVVPHADRFSEMALAQPDFFEWLQRKDTTILRHDDGLSETVSAFIFTALQGMLSAAEAAQLPADYHTFFKVWPEEKRLLLMFGAPNDYQGRLHRRKLLIKALHDQGFETVPATMAPPYRGIEVDPTAAGAIVDTDGLHWREYRITRPEPMSRVFGPLSRYKLYGAKDNNIHWELDFDAPQQAVWEYVCQHYSKIQRDYHFDFMRGDMSHVQMRQNGVPKLPDAFYDLLGAVKQHVLAEKPWFGYFAESFLAPPGEMAYGDECDHLEACHADSTLGDLQAEPVGTTQFVRLFAQYRQWLETRKFSPNFTLMTADKDDPRFDGFYLDGNEIRYFLALFLTDMPSYMALGFECRDPHPSPVANEFYSKLYVFHMSEGPKSTQGPWRWGRNSELYSRLVRQKDFSAQWDDHIRRAPVSWLLAPDPDGTRKVIGWTQANDARLCCFANLNTKSGAVIQPEMPPNNLWKIVFSTHRQELPVWNKDEMLEMLPGEGVVFAQI
ncbi:MAG: hypothetical protein IPL65_03085 [Lewinellaceae bacterium]|nr:hypothetical protein [Lewinellaceae bacterium]